MVEVTLVGLGGDLEQDLDDRLEVIDLATGLPAVEERAADGAPASFIRPAAWIAAGIGRDPGGGGR